MSGSLHLGALRHQVWGQGTFCHNDQNHTKGKLIGRYYFNLVIFRLHSARVRATTPSSPIQRVPFQRHLSHKGRESKRIGSFYSSEGVTPGFTDHTPREERRNQPNYCPIKHQLSSSVFTKPRPSTSDVVSGVPRCLLLCSNWSPQVGCRTIQKEQLEKRLRETEAKVQASLSNFHHR